MMEEWETKMKAIINTCINEDVITCRVPSWMLVLLKKIQEKTGKHNLLELYCDVFPRSCEF